MEKIVSFPARHDPPPKPKPKSKPRNMTPDGRRCVRVDAGYDPVTGKRIRKAFYGKTLKEATRKAEQFKQELTDGRNPIGERQSLDHWIDTWLDAYGQRNGHSTNYVQRLNTDRLRENLGQMKLSEIRQIHVQSFADSISHYSKSTVSKLRYTTNQIFRSAVANRIITHNPCDGVQWRNAGEGTHRRLTDEEVRLIMKHWNAHRTGLWVMLMLFAGLRRGEALALQWNDINLDKKLLHVRHGIHFEDNQPVLGAPKTLSSVRSIPILPPLMNAITIADRLSDTWVCTGAQGQPVTQSIWSSSWSAWLNTMSNILNNDTTNPVAPGRRSDKDTAPRHRFEIRAHDLRHTYASMLYDAGVDLKTAQKLLGHSTPDVTMKIYTHLSEQRQQTSIDQMIAYTSALSNGHQMGISPNYSSKK